MRTRQRREGAIPWPLTGLASFGILLLVVPLIGIAVRAPWTRLGSIATSDVVLDALRLSLFTSMLATILSVLLGVPLAYVLARGEWPGRRVLRALVTLPMVLPPVVGGAALLFSMGRRGVIGGPLHDATGLSLPFSVWGVVLANTFVAMPFLVVSLEGAFATLDPGYEHAASSLGAPRFTILRRVTLPSVAPALRAGAILAWARALGEFGATVTFAGNLQGRTQTLPLAVFVALEADREAAIAMSLLLVAVSFVVLLALRDRWWGGR